MIIRKKYLFMGLFLLCLAGVAGLYLKGSAEESEGKVEIKWLYPPKYYKGNEFIDGRAWVQEEKNGPWSLLDDQGNVLKKGFVARKIMQYTDGVAAFYISAGSGPFPLCGFVNRSGDVVASPDLYENGGGTYGEGLISKGIDAKDENKPFGLSGFVDMKGEWVIPPVYEMAFEFSEGLAPVRRDYKWGFIDKAGTVKIDITYEYLLSFSHGMAVVMVFVDPIGWQFGVIDREGNWIAEPKYDKFYMPWSNLIGLQKNGKVGFIDANGNVAIDFKFPPIEGEILQDSGGVYCFSQGRAPVILNPWNKKEPRYGIIDESGTVLFKTGKRPLNFKGDYVVEQNAAGETILIGKNGSKYALPPELRHSPTKIIAAKDNIFWVRHNKKVGYFSIKAEVRGD